MPVRAPAANSRGGCVVRDDPHIPNGQADPDHMGATIEHAQLYLGMRMIDTLLQRAAR